MTLVLTQGDDWAEPIQLKLNNDTFNIPDDATVKALVINNLSNVSVGPVELDHTNPEGDWNLSLVVVEMTATVTADADPGPSVLEIEVNDGSRTTFQTDVIIKKQHIANS